ncbi:hypothetical protein G7Y79_00039g075980 [Physcia stellaris]|nr:hypothetical protein G7Y79_00039g075980 [Physcia stellaris]
MASKQTRAGKAKAQAEGSNQERQPSVEEESSSENNTEIRNQQLVQTTQREMPVIHSIASEAPHPTVRGLSNETVTDLTRLFGAMLDEKLDRRLPPARRLFEEDSETEETQPHLSVTRPLIRELKRPAERPAVQSTEQPADQPAEQPIPPTQNANDLAVRLFGPKLKAEDVGFFDPEEQEEDKPFTTIVHSGKHVFYKDVYVFVERLQDMAKQYDEKTIEDLVTGCLRGDALEWYTIEIDDNFRDLLRDAKLDKWSRTLINRFKTRATVALSRLTNQKYSLNDIKRGVTPRAWFLQMLRYAKAANLLDTFNQVTMIWNRFDVILRRDIPEPNEHTTVARFLQDIDAKTSIWYEMADRQADRQAAYQRQQQSSGATSYRQQYTNRGGQNGNTKPPPKTPAGDKPRQAYVAEAAQDTPYGYHLNEAEEDEFDEDEMPVN